MTTPSVKSEDRFEGASNFNAWKARVLNILEENDLDVTWSLELLKSPL